MIMLKLNDMIVTLRTNNERIEIRDAAGNELLTAPQDSSVIDSYLNRNVITWFPHGAPGKDATFTVYISYDEGSNNNV